MFVRHAGRARNAVPSPALLPLGAGTSEWPAWGTTARLVVIDPGRLPAARRLVRRQLAAVDKACSLFRGDSEVHRVKRAGGRPVRVSELLAELVAVSLRAADRSDGDVDPTMGVAMVRLGRGRDVSLLPTCGGWEVHERPAPGWRRVHLDGRVLTVPVGVLLDLAATAKAHTADRCARIVAALCDTGVLVDIGGDIATAGPAPQGGWRVPVPDQPGDPSCTVVLPAGGALATSGTADRPLPAGGRATHHIVDPRTCQPIPPAWRTVSVVDGTCVEANTVTTAAAVRGTAALAWLRELGVPARLVAADRRVITVGAWPVAGG